TRANMLAQCFGPCERYGVEDSFFVLHAGRCAGFELDPREAEQAMDWALLQVDIGHSIERDGPAGARQKSAVDSNFMRANAIFELEPAEEQRADRDEDEE